MPERKYEIPAEDEIAYAEEFDKRLENGFTPLQDHFAEWIADKTEVEFKTAKEKDAFLLGAKAALWLRMYHQKSPENHAFKAELAERREASAEERAEAAEARKAERAQAREAKAADAAERPARKTKAAAEKAPAKTSARRGGTRKAAATEEAEEAPAKRATTGRPARRPAAAARPGRPATRRGAKAAAEADF